MSTEDTTKLIEDARLRYKLASDEMDRLTAASPGASWRWSIPANPDRDSDLILGASAEDVPRLADALESLVSVNEDLRAHLGTERDYSTISSAIRVRNSNIRQLTRERDEAKAERDALRAQLDSIRVIVQEWVVPTFSERHYGSHVAMTKVRKVVSE